MAERFFLDQPLALGLVELSGPEARHLAQVRRFRPGDAVTLFNGDGKEYAGRVEAIERRTVLIQLDQTIEPQRELPFTLHVASALPKGDRAQFLVEKLTEIGAASLTPLVCHRSVVQPGEGKMEKLERYVVEASKQCGRNVLMQVEEPTVWANFLGRRASGEVMLLAHPGESVAALPVLAPGSVCRIAIGPEGGFTDEETRLALEAGWRRVSLGPRILRVETAALVLAAWAVASGAAQA
ncbi:MAG: 16S rRNA (uracil(1498)-N(3))-methyltransferase [Gemmataceae bacterium]